MNIRENIDSLDIGNQFAVLRQNLLDLTMRNSLLNFCSGKRSIEVVDEISAVY